MEVSLSLPLFLRHKLGLGFHVEAFACGLVTLVFDYGVLANETFELDLSAFRLFEFFNIVLAAGKRGVMKAKRKRAKGSYLLVAALALRLSVFFLQAQGFLFIWGGRGA